jgi:hypothetical protein
MREALDIQALTFGNSYAEIVPNGRGDVDQLWPLFSDRMTPRRRTADLSSTSTRTATATTALPPERVYHLHGPGIAGLMGDNAVAHMAKSSLAGSRAGALRVDLLRQQHGDRRRAQVPAQAEAGDAHQAEEGLGGQVQRPVQGEQADHSRRRDGVGGVQQRRETRAARRERQHQVEEICRWFQVPPHKVGHLLRATFNNIEHLGSSSSAMRLTRGRVGTSRRPTTSCSRSARRGGPPAST